MAFKIVVLRGRRAGTEHKLEGRDVFVLGSGAEAHVRLEDEGVQANHARIFKDESRFILMDVSGSGVLVNGKAQVQAELRAGDELGLGGAILRITPAGVPLSAVLQKPPMSGAGAASQSGAELRILKGPDEGKTFPLGGRATLGRGVNADVALLDMKCSREHCTVEKRAEGWVLVDLGSTNGTRLNEIKLEPRGVMPLKAGDKLRLGGTVVEFHAGVAPAVARPATGLTPRQPPVVAAAPTGKVFEIDLDSPDTGPPSMPVASDDAGRRAVTQRMKASGLYKGIASSDTLAGDDELRAPLPTLEGDLEKMGFASVVQFLNLSHKTGDLRVYGPMGELGVSFSEGNVRDAWGAPGSTPEQCFYAIARLRHGHFEFHENVPPHDAKIRQGTLALLMEAMRLVDEATDPGE
ncbi:MAG: FHA domain-containing protein [Planctomycetota bacterium]